MNQQRCDKPNHFFGRRSFLADEDTPDQIGQVLRILEGSWERLARDLEAVEKQD
jgi:hypothetical protein